MPGLWSSTVASKSPSVLASAHLVSHDRVFIFNRFLLVTMASDALFFR